MHTRLLAIFVFTKIFEGVVTVNGEDLGIKEAQKIYSDLAYDALELQLQVFDYLIKLYGEKSLNHGSESIEKYLGSKVTDISNQRIVDMLKKMKDSIFDQDIGSLNKTIIKRDGTFKRSYQE